MNLENNKHKVYIHKFQGEIFYVGCGVGYRYRDFSQSHRSEDWWNFCNGNADTEVVASFSDAESGFKFEEELTKKLMLEGHPLVNKRFGQNIKGSGNPMYGRTGEKSPRYGIKGSIHPSYGTSHSQEFKDYLSEINSGENNKFFGKKHKEETKKRMSELKKGKPNWKSTQVTLRNNITNIEINHSSIVEAMSSVGFTDKIPTKVYTAIKNNVKLNYNEYSIFKSGVDIVSEQDFENKKVFNKFVLFNPKNSQKEIVSVEDCCEKIGVEKSVLLSYTANSCAYFRNGILIFRSGLKNIEKINVHRETLFKYIVTDSSGHIVHFNKLTKLSKYTDIPQMTLSTNTKKKTLYKRNGFTIETINYNELLDAIVLEEVL